MVTDCLRCSRCGSLPASRGLPGGNSLSFCVAKKKVSKEKGDPMVWVPSLRCGQPAVLAKSGVLLELASLKQSQALIRFCLRSSAQPDGWGKRRQTPIRIQIPNSHPECRKRAALQGRESQQTVMCARERSARGQMRLPSIAQRGEGRVGDALPDSRRARRGFCGMSREAQNPRQGFLPCLVL
jgi:hypothetical protein